MVVLENATHDLIVSETDMQNYPTKSFLHIRISTDLKLQAESLFRKMGMSPSSGVRMLLARFVVEGKHPTFLPFAEKTDQDDDVPAPTVPNYTKEQIELEQYAGKAKHGYYK